MLILLIHPSQLSGIPPDHTTTLPIAIYSEDNLYVITYSYLDDDVPWTYDSLTVWNTSPRPGVRSEDMGVFDVSGIVYSGMVFFSITGEFGRDEDGMNYVSNNTVGKCFRQVLPVVGQIDLFLPEFRRY